MKVILSTNKFTTNLRGDYKNNQYDYSSYRAPVRNFLPQNDTFVKNNRPSFNGFIHTQSEFRGIIRNHPVHCIYCKKPMINVDILKNFQHEGVFNGPVIRFLQKMTPYKNILKPALLEAFNDIERIALQAPQTHLSRIIKILHNESLIELRSIQRPIFNEIDKYVKQLPEPYNEKAMEVLLRHRNRMEGIAQQEEFNPKDFTYKIRNAAKTILLSNEQKSRIIQLCDLLNDKQLKGSKTDAISNAIFNSIFPKKNKFDYSLPCSIKSIQLYIVERIKQISSRQGYNDITNFCRTAEKTLLDKPVIVPFRNKAFIYDLKQVLNDCTNKHIKHKIFETAQKLPTSATNLNSFITKHQCSDSNTIGYNLFKPSIVTIEHITPTAKGGRNQMGNWALACAFDNNSRQDNAMNKILNKYDKNNTRYYFNEIIDLTNQSLISFEDMLQQSESIYHESGRRLSLKKLSRHILEQNFRNNSQQNFDKLVELSNKQLISGYDIYELQKLLQKKCGIYVEVKNLSYHFY